MPLTRLIYSSNHSGLDAGVLDEILVKSQANNERDDVTGVLVACEEDFMQLLEGSRAAVAECFMRIMQDDRHHKIRVLIAGEIEARQFAKWSMHTIDASQVERDIISHYMSDGSLNPADMSQSEIEALCQALSATA